MKRYEKYRRKLWNDIENVEENSEKIGKISWILKRYGKYGRKESWIVIRFGKYGRKISWIVKLFGKYEKKT